MVLIAEAPAVALPYDRRKAAVARHANPGGNYCGHVPNRPRLEPAITPVAGCPRVIIKACERLRAYYERPNATLPELDAASLSARQTRSEAREAQIAWMSTLLLHTELSTMRVGRPTAQGFQPHTHKILAERSGLSMTRALRASARWNLSGYLTTSQHHQRTARNEWAHHPASRLIADRLFEQLGLRFELAHARKAATKRRSREAAAAAVPLSTVLRIASAIQQRSSPCNGGRARQQAPLRLGRSMANKPQKQRARWVSDTLIRLRQQHPEWDDHRLIAAVKSHPDY